MLQNSGILITLYWLVMAKPLANLAKLATPSPRGAFLIPGKVSAMGLQTLRTKKPGKVTVYHR